jgi:hypothetical protein
MSKEDDLKEQQELERKIQEQAQKERERQREEELRKLKERQLNEQKKHEELVKGKPTGGRPGKDD